MRQNSQSLNDDDGGTTTITGTRIETFRRMNRNRPLKVTFTFVRFIILILLYLWVFLFGFSSNAWMATNNNNKNSVDNNNSTKNTNGVTDEKNFGKFLDDPRGIVNVRRVNERGIKEQEEYIKRLETKRKERQERIRKRREELESSQNVDDNNNNETNNITTSITTPHKISRRYPPPKTPHTTPFNASLANITTSTSTPRKTQSTPPPPSTTSITFLTLLTLITILRILTTLIITHLATPSPPTPSLSRHYRTLISRLNATRAANGHPPISLPTLRLILSQRDFSPNDYDDLLRVEEESGPALEALVSGWGATRVEIERLPQCELREGDDLLVEREREGSVGRGRCVICLEEYRVGDVVRRIPCFHCFHAGCIDPWLGVKAECPVCKHPALG